MKHIFLFLFLASTLSAFGQQDSVTYEKRVNTSETYKGDSIYYKLTYTKQGEVMTATAPSHQEIRFPDAGDHLRGKKIIVYQKKKEAGSFIPQIKVVGGVSRLYYTTNTLPGGLGTDPSDQSSLDIDDSTWSSHGTTFEFTCLRIDNTPSYRWVLKQR